MPARASSGRDVVGDSGDRDAGARYAECVAPTARFPLIACSLDATGQQARLAQWRDVLGAAVSREETSAGVRYTFVADAQTEQRIRDLAVAEHGCCSFLEFDVTRHTNQVLMNVTAGPEGLDALRFIFPA